MASWRDSMGPASFRGVQFHVDSNERAGGRRQVKHEFPFKDKPYFDDLGLKGRAFPVEGYVLGDDYLTLRDSLCDALEQSGSGELISPYHGVRNVVVLTYRVRESTDRGGIAFFAIEFEEAPVDSLQPTIAADVKGAGQDATSAAADSVQDQFSTDYVPGVRLEALQELLASVRSTVFDALLGVSLQEQELASVVLGVTSLTADLLRTPTDLFASITSLIGQFQDGSESVLYTLYNFDPGVLPPATTPSRVIEQANFYALQRLVQRLAVIQLALVAIGKTFPSYDDAITSRDSITALLDDQAEIASDDTYPALSELRAAVVQAVPGEGQDLPHLLTYVPVYTIPSLVLAHRLYGNTDLELDLVARNDIADPTRILGGSQLEVLSNAG